MKGSTGITLAALISSASGMKEEAVKLTEEQKEKKKKVCPGLF
jgi:hypothetical protein